jgi:hypothetical protein
MRRLSSYVKKYGEKAGRALYHALQSQAAQARWKQFYKIR